MKLHPDAPRPLKRLFRKLGSTRKVAEHCGVNRGYVYNLLVNGRAPSNRSIGRRLFVEYPSFNRVSVGDGRFKHIRWWMHLTRNQRAALVEFLYHYKEDQRGPGQKNERQS